MKLSYSLDEVALIPTVLSDIKSRKEINPYTDGNKLPIFVSPMTCVLNENNFDTFNKSLFIPIYPVFNNGHDVAIGTNWEAITLDRFRELAEKLDQPDLYEMKICVDVANGHMAELYELAPMVKQNYPNCKIMIGNIGNPLAYLNCCKAGIDYVRVGISGGTGCATGPKTGIHGGLVSMLTEIQLLKKNIRALSSIKFKPISLKTAISEGQFKCETKVVADGGINTIAKIIKCLALGADYVMCGHLFAQCKESASLFYYGQSSEYGQMDRRGSCDKHIEGVNVPEVNKVWDIESLAEEIEMSLRSAMSYSGAHNLNEFIGKCNYQVQTISEFESYNK